jgi:hypothetical protein
MPLERFRVVADEDPRLVTVGGRRPIREVTVDGIGRPDEARRNG